MSLIINNWNDNQSNLKIVETDYDYILENNRSISVGEIRNGETAVGYSRFVLQPPILFVNEFYIDTKNRNEGFLTRYQSFVLSQSENIGFNELRALPDAETTAILKRLGWEEIASVGDRTRLSFFINLG